MASFHVIMTFTFNQCAHTERFPVSAQNDNVGKSVCQEIKQEGETKNF